MKKRAWKSKIKSACKEAGTYKPYFEYVINTLAEVLEKRDEAMDMYNMDADEKIIIKVTNKNGTAKVKNPLIAIWEDLNKLALNYWRDLGLTPAGLKKLNEEAFMQSEEKKGNSLIGLFAKQKEAKKDE